MYHYDNLVLLARISALVFITKGPPLAIGSPIGLPAINKNSLFYWLLQLIYHLCLTVLN